jgi:CPA1 family monovalent cation:H+ antiporter
VCAGGAAVGLLLGYAAYKVLAYIDDHLIEVTITLILAFSSFILAEHLHTSGVIAVVASGLIIGNYGKLFSMSPSTRVALITFWDFAVFIVNSLIFLIIGIDIHPEKLLSYAREVAIAIAVVLAARALAVYPLLNLLNLKLRSKIPLLWQHVIFWGGLHGTIPVALALGLEKDFPMRELLASMTFGVVLFSLVFQGLSIEVMVRRSSLVKKHEMRLEYEEKLAFAIANKAARREIESMVDKGEISQKIARELISELEDEAKKLSREIAQLVEKDGGIQKEERFAALRRSLEAKKSAVREAIVRGLISEEIGRKVIEEIDAELDLLYQERS